MDYKSKFSFYERKTQTINVIKKYPDRIPIICEKNKKSNKTVDIDKNKYLVPYDFTVGQFMYVIRRRLELSPEIGLYFFINGIIPATCSPISYVYENNKDEDGYLYITYSMENTFGFPD
jgi:GABA(A) receptor-associated protein